ncbi:bifunctional methylenetetrahydrofolate dehydrogenase/methenyltetrahydrofolate cyclohydrolase FolD [bacterium]|nr:bifunctional methylenetetrahydrofolate dehydrogenase/methenyltetrahydrofolate cyclohydrolase FolD [bacterium]
MAVIIDGKKASGEILRFLQLMVADIKLKHNIAPTLAVILVGDDPASKVYVSKKEEMAKKIGFNSLMINLPDGTGQKEIAEKIEELNQDDEVNAILVQLPLPDYLDSHALINGISPMKDVDGFTPYNFGLLATGKESVVPCTALGIMKLLEEYNIQLAGKNVTIVGRSNIVGKPLAHLMMAKNATVTVAHSKTENLKEHTLNADILVCATGKKHLITSDMVKEGAVVIDVGITRGEDGKLAGDVDYENVKEKASFITPVPGGVGPMTIAMLAYNTYKLFAIQKAFPEGSK